MSMEFIPLMKKEMMVPTFRFEKEPELLTIEIISPKHMWKFEDNGLKKHPTTIVEKC